MRLALGNVAAERREVRGTGLPKLEQPWWKPCPVDTREALCPLSSVAHGKMHIHMCAHTHTQARLSLQASRQPGAGQSPLSQDFSAFMQTEGKDEDEGDDCTPWHQVLPKCPPNRLSGWAPVPSLGQGAALSASMPLAEPLRMERSSKTQG